MSGVGRWVVAELVGLALVTTPVGAVAWAPAPAPAPAPSDDAAGTTSTDGPPPSSPPPSSDPVETVEDPATVLESEEVEPEEVEPEPFDGDPAEALLAPGQTMPRKEQPAPAPSQPPERDVPPAEPEPKHKGTALLYPGLGLIVGGVLTSNVSLYIDDQKHPGLADWGGISGSLAMLSGVVLTVWGSIRVARYRKWKKRNPQAVGLAGGRGSAGTRTLGLRFRF